MTTISEDAENEVKLEFSDVLWTIEESQYVNEGDDDKFGELNEDVVVVQPLHIHYNWDRDDDYRIRTISFDIVNDIIDFDCVPELCEYHVQ